MHTSSHEQKWVTRVKFWEPVRDTNDGSGPPGPPVSHADVQRVGVCPPHLERWNRNSLASWCQWFFPAFVSTYIIPSLALPEIKLVNLWKREFLSKRKPCWMSHSANRGSFFRDDSFPGLYLSSLRLEMGVGHFLKLLMWLEVGAESSSDPRVLQLGIRQKINTWCVFEDGSILRSTLKDVDDLQSKNS